MKRFNQKFPFKGHKNVQDNSIKILFLWRYQVSQLKNQVKTS